MASRKVILTCAITGSGHTPTMSPHLPYTVDDVVTQSIDAAEAGASIIHLHARDPRDGRPTPDPDVFMEYLSRIKARSDVVLSVSSGGGTGMSVAQRLEGVLRAKPELATLNMGSMNYGGFTMIDRYRGKWKFDWEEPYLEQTRRDPFLSTYADIEYMLERGGAGNRRAIRVRGLRHGAPLHARLLPRSRAWSSRRSSSRRSSGRWAASGPMSTTSSR